jgi:5-methylcytosine-specific restriction enzyme subunit McrC
MATLFQAREREETAIPITEVLKDGEIDIFPEVQNQKYFEIRFRGRRLIITAGKYVGFIPLNDRAIIYVEPKIPTINLVHLLSVAGGVVALGREREYKLTGLNAPPLLEAMARAFIAHLEDMEVDGLFKTYLSVSAAESILKGQIRFRESMQQLWSRGKSHQAVSSYFDLTADVPENQVLYFACRSLIQHFQALGLAPDALKVLGQFEELFTRAGVSLRLPMRQETKETGLSVTHLRAMRLAFALVDRRGVELPLGGTDIFLPSFLIDMESLFEEYVICVLAQHLSTFQVVGAKDSTKPLFEDTAAPTANPDIVIYRDGRAVLVGDVKYKLRYTREDLNQVISYALSYGVATTVLFLPALNEQEAGLVSIGKIKGIQVYQYMLWLGSGQLSQAAERMSAAVATILPTGRSSVADHGRDARPNTFHKAQ